MKLLDLKKLAVKDQMRVRFPIAGGRECVITEHGISRVPGLDSPPDFNLEEELVQAERFTLEPAETGKDRHGPKSRVLGRPELEALVAAGRGTAGSGQGQTEE